MEAGRKDDVIRFRVNEDQRRAIEAKADAAGLSVSAWILGQLQIAAGHELHKDDRAAL